MTGIDYEEFKMQIHPGELLAMYTDGVFEAPNKNGDQFSIARVKSMVGETSNSLFENGNALIASVTQHIVGCAQEDDMCLVMLNRLAVS
jgi:sigma-B regulation protein RsbU (phosphoserine phosphatase)